MKDELILKKAIEKVVRNGYKAVQVSWMLEYLESPEGQKSMKMRKGHIALFRQDKIKYVLEKTDLFKYLPEAIIFSHSFAKAFWGEQITLNRMSHMPDWQYHLQQMVLEKNPLKYLERFIKD